MRKIKSAIQKTTRPITIELTGAEAEELLAFLGNVKTDDCFAAAEELLAKKLGVCGDRIDGMTDALFEMLDNHVEGKDDE